MEELPAALALAAAGCGVVPARTSSPAECAELARTHGAAILVGADHRDGAAATEALPARCFGQELTAQQPAVEVAIHFNELGGRLALEGLQGALVDEATVESLKRGDIAMESFTEADFDGPHIDGPANFGHLRPDFFFLGCAHECAEGGESLLLDGEAMVDALLSHTGLGPAAESLSLSDDEAAAESEPDVELADDDETVITVGMRRPWRNRLVHTMDSGRRVIKPGNAGRLPSSLGRDTAEVMALWQAMVDHAGRSVPRFKLHAGEALLVDNYRLLHGRDRYYDLNRKIFRVWFWTEGSIGLPSHLDQAYPRLQTSPPPQQQQQQQQSHRQQTQAEQQSSVVNPEPVSGGGGSGTARRHGAAARQQRADSSSVRRRLATINNALQGPSGSGSGRGAAATGLVDMSKSSAAGGDDAKGQQQPQQQPQQQRQEEEEAAWVREFTERGFVAIPNALSAAELVALNAAVEKDRERFFYLWPLANHEPFGAQGPCFANMNILLTSPDAGFDEIITHPNIYPLAKRLMGADSIRFEEFSVTIREPILEDQPDGSRIKQQAWHRDDSHWIDHPLLLRSLSVVVYLTDVDASGHSFSIVPESLATKRTLPGVAEGGGEGGAGGAIEERLLEDDPAYSLPNADAPPGGEGSAVDVVGAAGTAIFFHTGNLHAGTVRQTDRLRHSIHLYYGHEALPPLSDRLTAVPKRLSEHGDPEIRQLFSKKNEITRLFESNFN